MTKRKECQWYEYEDRGKVGRVGNEASAKMKHHRCYHPNRKDCIYAIIADFASCPDVWPGESEPKPEIMS